MRRYFTAQLFALVFLPLAAMADQLAWNSRADVERVVNGIQCQIKQSSKPYRMVAYCSMADEDYIEVWEVKDVVAVAIPGIDYFEMNVFGTRILRSAQAISEGKYTEPICYELLPENGDTWFLLGVDLAYVYIPLVGDFYRCVGKEFKLPCEVNVEWIKIPKKVFKMKNKKKHANTVGNNEKK